MSGEGREVTTAQVRRVYSLAPVDFAACNHTNRTPDYAADLFDRWLKAHDAEVAAATAERIAVAIEKARHEHEAEDAAEGCMSRFCAGWLLGQSHAAGLARAETKVNPR